MSRKELERIGEINDDWTCICKNTTHAKGFFPCDNKGNVIFKCAKNGDISEPEPDSDWKHLWRCDGCGRIITEKGVVINTVTDKDSLHYSAHIKLPKNKKDGLCNFIQAIINQAEKGDSREAMLTAVDLLNDLKSGIYDDAIGQKAIADVTIEKSNLERQMEKDREELKGLAEQRYVEGFKAGDQARMDKVLSALGITS